MAANNFSRKKVALMVAMDKELELLIDHKYFDKIQIGSFLFYLIDRYTDDIDLIVCKSGIGKVNAASAATALIMRWQPDIIISSGVCGSLADKFVNQGDIHLTSIVRYHDVWCGEPNEYGQVQEFPSYYRLLSVDESDFIKSVRYAFETDKRNVWTGLTLSGDWFVDTYQKASEIINKSINNEYGHIAIDMESAAIAQVAYSFSVERFISARIISDAILNNDCKKYEEFWSEASDLLHRLIEHILNNINLLFNGKN